jgi:hypothetical protein
MNITLPRLALVVLVPCAVLGAPVESSAQERASQPAASAAPTGAPVAAPAPVKRRRNPDLITTEEIAEINATDAYAAVARLRANWLRKRGVSSINREGSILVYQDGIRMGGPGSLRQINVAMIGSISYLDGMQATQRFGIDHGNGAILVTTRR